MGTITISDLKKHLGPGLGLRKNRYVIEFPSGGIKKNVLCMATSLPERAMSTTTVFFNGRKYNIRGETEYNNTFEVSFVDDSNMYLRQEFDAWLNAVDNSNFNTTSEQGNNKSITVHPDYKANNTSYKTEVNIWQVGNDGETGVYGYCLQDCFVSSVGSVALEDTTENQMSEFSVTFTYSEFVPIVGPKKLDLGSGQGGAPGVTPNTSPYAKTSQITNDISTDSLISSFDVFK